MCVNQKLIRLTANSSDFIGRQAIFETIFNDGILIEPNSSIALQSVSFTRNAQNLVIDNTNSKIIFSTNNTNGNERVIHLPHGEYDNERFIELLNTIQDSLNDSLVGAFDVWEAEETNGIYEDDSKVEIQVVINDQDKVEINFLSARSVSFISAPPADGGYNAIGARYSRVSGNDMLVLATNAFAPLGFLRAERQNVLTGFTKLEAYVYDRIPLTQGLPAVKIRINKFIGAQGGCRIGILKKTNDMINRLEANNELQRIGVDDFECMITTNADGSHFSPYQITNKNPLDVSQTNGLKSTLINPYKVDENGVATDNDILSIECVGNGAWQLCVNNDLNGRQIVSTWLAGDRREANGELIEYIVYIGIANSNTHVSFATANLESVSRTTPASNFDIDKENTTLVGATPYPDYYNRPLRVPNLVFQSTLVSNYLGYTSASLNAEGAIFVLGKKFEAENPRTTFFSTNTYLVELLSELLDSFDSFEGGRKNILAPIPITDRNVGNAGIVNFQPNNLVYINLKNKKQRLIRNIDARIVSDQYEPFIIEGLAEINLLIKNEE